MTVPFLFDTVVHAVALWGYAALLLTGQLPVVIVAAGGLLVIPSWFLGRRGHHLRPLWANVITIAAFGVSIIIGSRNLLDAGLYFIMFLQLLKLYSKRTAADNMWVFLVGFFQIVGAAVLTSSVGFAVVFVVYVLLMVAGLILYTIERGRDIHLRKAATELGPAGMRRADRTKWMDAHRIRMPAAVVTPGFLASLGPISLSVLIVASLFFMVFPRLSTQRLFDGTKPRIPPQNMSGFEESIEFGAFQKIQLDSTVALYVRPITWPRPSHLRLRGVALDNFDGRQWRRTSNARPGDQLFFQMTRRRYAQESHYLMIQPPGVTSFLFADALPERIQVSPHIQCGFDPLSHAALLAYPLHKQFEYTAVSRRELLEDRVDPEKLPQMARSAPLNQPRTADRPEEAVVELARGIAGLLRESPPDRKTGHQKYREDRFLKPMNPYSRMELQRHAMQVRYVQKCLQLPASLETTALRSLAAEWTAAGKTPFEKALLIETQLRTQFRYSLDQVARGNYIEDFLLRAREGHCEYFATSMVILLRNLGMPARVVNGYYAIEWNDMARVFTVRQRDAHSWVEVYFDDYGWMTFDPTPPSGVGRPVPFSALLSAFERIVDTCKVYWYRHVVDFSFADQIGYMRDMHHALTNLLASVNAQEWVRIEGVFTDTGEVSPWFAVTLLLAAAAVLAALFRLAVHALRSAAGRTNTLRRRPVPFYDAVLKLLARLGHRRADWETPREFAERLAAMPGLEPFAAITESYYLCRYRGDEPTGEQLAAAREFTSSLARQKAAGRPRPK